MSTGGTKATGGSTSTGGAKATGGFEGTGGAQGTGGAAVDRCDVGVYDSAKPPKALTLTGSLDAHDPSAIESNGTYYEFQTGLGAKTSTNLTTWSGASAPFAAPAWMKSAVTGVTDLWAPDISSFGGTYHLYYAGSTFGTNKSCIGHATRASLSTGSWADQGSATICSNITTTGDNWNAIDPNVVVDADGTPWLVFGSFWGGIKIIQLDQTGARAGTTLTGIAARPSNGGALEGPFMVRRCGYYYLFTSWDTCCKGASSTYNMRVVRGTSVTGPFADKAGTAAMQGGGTLIAQGDSTWAGPGGQSVMIVGTKAYLVYHAYAMSDGTATLRIADLVWDSNGWPIPVGP
jgi:arabinan endo-1,5-alpha-L-arabinosidase